MTCFHTRLEPVGRLPSRRDTTILHQLGFDQDKLTFPHLGRRERLTLVEGKVIKSIV